MDHNGDRGALTLVVEHLYHPQDGVDRGGLEMVGPGGVVVLLDVLCFLFMGGRGGGGGEGKEGKVRGEERMRGDRG